MNELIVRPGTEMTEVPAPVETRDFSPTRPQKAAIVLSLIDANSAADLLKDFNERTLLQFAKAVSELKPVPPRLVEQVALEFLSELSERTDVKGGISQVREFLGQFLDADNVERIIQELNGEDIRPLWERLADAPIDETVSLLALEHPQAVAVILSRLRPDKSAAVLERLETDFAQLVVLRMSKAPSPVPSVIRDVEDVLDEDFLSVISRKSSAIKPAELIGTLMNNVSGAARDGFLQHLEEADASFAQDVAREMFTFADIVERVPPMTVPMIVKDMEEERLLIALRFARDSNNPSYDFFMGNLSKRLSERLAEDIDSMEEVKEKDGEAAQMEVTNLIQKKAKMGEIKLIEQEFD